MRSNSSKTYHSFDQFCGSCIILMWLQFREWQMMQLRLQPLSIGFHSKNSYILMRFRLLHGNWYCSLRLQFPNTAFSTWSETFEGISSRDLQKYLVSIKRSHVTTPYRTYVFSVGNYFSLSYRFQNTYESNERPHFWKLQIKGIVSRDLHTCFLVSIDRSHFATPYWTCLFAF
jgi:hypothetical protein